MILRYPVYVIGVFSLCAFGQTNVGVSVSTVDRSDGFTTYAYTFEIPAGAKHLLFHLDVGPSLSMPSKGSSMEKISSPSKTVSTTGGSPGQNSTSTTATSTCSDPCWEWKSASGADKPVLILSARTSETQPAQLSYTIGGDATGSGNITGPRLGYDPAFFSVLLGAGTLLTTRTATDYTIVQNTQTLSASQLGRNHVDLIVGGSFNLGIRKFGHPNAGVDKPWSAFISLKFTPGSQNTINGFVFGGGHRITKYLDIIAGVGLTPINEPAIGLRRVAYGLVTQYPNEYPGFIANDLLLNKGQAPFDGFPLTRNGMAIYNGNPLELHYHAGAFVGVAFPISFRASFSGQQ